VSSSKTTSDQWLRLFELMSGEFAQVERCVVPTSVPGEAQRRREISELARSLNALQVLESVSYGFRGTDFPIASGYKPTHYLIRYNHTTKTVQVEPHEVPSAATRSYDIAEELDNRTGGNTLNVVLVEVDKIDNLKAAYPNYFGDVELFKSQLRQITRGGSAVEYAVSERQVPVPVAARRIDLLWLKGGRYPGPRLNRRTPSQK